jgi:hypothetical protein
MIAQKKAKELAERFNFKLYEAITDPIVRAYEAKQCALFAVDEILKAAFYSTDEIYHFYLEVKQEIEKL